MLSATPQAWLFTVKNSVLNGFAIKSVPSSVHGAGCQDRVFLSSWFLLKGFKLPG